MALLRVTAYVKASSPQFVPLQTGDTLARVDQFSIKADSFAEAGEAVWSIGNRMSSDIHGKCWPCDVRSMSVGDLVRVSYDGPAWSLALVDFRAGPRSEHHCVERCGWREWIGPSLRVIAIEGACVTSRTADAPPAPPEVDPPSLAY